MKVAVFGQGSKGSREVNIARAMAKGAKRHGHQVLELDQIPQVPVGDVLIAYGWIHELAGQMFSRFKNAGRHYVFVDLGYWGRSQTGYHRLAVDDWDSLHSLKAGMPDDRLRAGGLVLSNEWGFGHAQVMVAGMSSKAARSHGYEFLQWEKATAAALKDLLPDHQIQIRQKPQKSDKVQPPSISEVLKTAYFVASHHSNVSVDCLRAGIPYWCVKGVGERLSISTLTDTSFQNLAVPSDEDRWQLLADIAYVQYNLDEMANGTCWNYIKDFII